MHKNQRVQIIKMVVGSFNNDAAFSSLNKGDTTTIVGFDTNSLFPILVRLPNGRVGALATNEVKPLW